MAQEESVGWRKIEELARKYITLVAPGNGPEISIQDGKIIYDRRTPEQAMLANEIVTGITNYIYKIAYDLKNSHLTFQARQKDIHLSLRKSSLTIEDLANEGVIGVLISLHKYDPKFAFSTFIRPRIASAMQRSSTNQASIVRLPQYMRERAIRVISRSNSRNQAIKRLARIGSGSRRLGIHRAALAYFAISRRYISIHEPVSLKEGSVAEKFEDTFLPDEDAHLNLEEYPDDIRLHETAEKLLTQLAPTQAKVLRERLGIDEHTLEDIAADLNVSSERVRQIEVNALRKMKHPSRRRRLIDYA